MNESYESYRLGIFAFLLMLFVVLEFIIPMKRRVDQRKTRWTYNLLLMLLGALLGRITIAAVPLTLITIATEQGFGFLNLFSLHPVTHTLLTYVLLDLVIYFQHRLFHEVEFLWRFHKVHHTDLDLDVTSGFRFHPIEIVLSLAIKSALVWLLGANILGYFIFEVLLSSGALFNHSNIKLPAERWIRFILVTPRMHLIHHSPIEAETNSNYSFIFSLWDRIFQTYKENPEEGYENMRLGLEKHQDKSKLSLKKLFFLPFEKHG